MKPAFYTNSRLHHRAMRYTDRYAAVCTYLFTWPRLLVSCPLIAALEVGIAYLAGNLNATFLAGSLIGLCTAVALAYWFKNRDRKRRGAGQCNR